MKSPIFIIGNPRSGTTLLRLMLTCHRNIVIPPECGFAVWWYQKYRNWNSESAKQNLDAFLDDLFGSKKIETWNLNRELLRETLSEKEPESYSDLVSLIYEKFAMQQKETFKRWGDKNNYYLNHIETIFELFSDVQFIHIVRDGRDIACSYKKLAVSKFDSKYAPQLPTEISEIAREWINNLKKIRKSFQTIGWDKVIEIRYEDLVTESEKTLRNICSFLNEEYDPSMSDFYLLNMEKELEPRELMQWKGKTLEKPTRSEVEKYQIELTLPEIKEFEIIAEELLAHYRYL